MRWHGITDAVARHNGCGGPFQTPPNPLSPLGNFCYHFFANLLLIFF
jgi:hypothetical protein